MDRRQTIKMLGGAAAIAGTGFPGFAFAQAQKEMVTVVKIAGIPWFNALEKGIQKGAKDFSINATMVGPANVEVALNYTCTNWATRIEIYANDQRIEETDGGGPEGKYSFTWEDAKPGKYVLKAVVYDDLGVKGESSSVNIVVKDRQKKGQ